MNLTVVLGSAAVVSSLFVLWWAVSGERAAHAADLSADVSTRHSDLRELVLDQSAGERAFGPLIERVGARVRRVLPSGRTAALARKIQHAGAPEGWTVDRVLAAKVLLALLFGALFLLNLLTDPTFWNFVFAIAATLFGYYLPEGLLDSRANRRKIAIRSEVADTIDQIGVMVRAGLGLDAAIARAARSGSGPLGEEFTRVVQDMRVGVSRSVAMANLAERVDVPEVRGFVNALAQAEKLGVPISRTLEIQSGELRIKRRQLAEEQAMKLPVKILFPMVIFILPVIFIVLLGPAVIRIMDQF